MLTDRDLYACSPNCLQVRFDAYMTEFWERGRITATDIKGMF
jgi:hypothetical protein